MPYDGAFHPGIHCLPKYLLAVIKKENVLTGQITFICCSDYNVTRLPKIKREVNLDVVAPNTDIVLTEVPMGRLIQLRLTYDNTYSNSKN